MVVLRSALRRLSRSPFIAGLIIITLAIGIGANAAIFAIVETLLGKPLPGVHAARLVSIRWKPAGLPDDLALSGYDGLELSYPILKILQSNQALFSGLAGFASLGFKEGNAAVSVDGVAEPATGSMVSANFFSVLRVPFTLGLGFDDTTGAPDSRYVVLSTAFWARRFEQDPAVIGRMLKINGIAFSILGIAGDGFGGVQPGQKDDFWIPFIDSPSIRPWASEPPTRSGFDTNRWWWITPIGTLAGNVPQSKASSLVVSQLSQVLSSEFPQPDGPRQISARVISVGSGLTYLQDDLIKPAAILMGMATLLLLTTCSNVAMVLFAQAEKRRREMAIRSAVGASTRAIYIQLIAESSLLAVCGAALGLLCSIVIARSISHLLAAGNPPLDLNIGLDWRVIVYLVLITALSVLIFGAVPGLRTARFDIKHELSGSQRALLLLRRRFRLGQMLILWQSALSVTLVFGAILLIGTLYNLTHKIVGFDVRNLYVFRVHKVAVGGAPGTRAATYTRLLDELRTLPGVESASLAQNRLIDGWDDESPVRIEGYNPPGKKYPVLHWNVVGPDYLKTTGIPILLGRDITYRDRAGSPHITVINQKLAAQYFPERDAVGKHLSISGLDGALQTYQIVGICGNTSYANLREEMPAMFYIAYAQVNQDRFDTLNIELKVANASAISNEIVRRIAQRVDPDLVISDAKMQTEQIKQSLVNERILSRLGGLFGGFALLLSCIGIYGTVSHAVGSRTREIGIRMALGAERSRVFLSVLRETAWLTILGSVCGIAIALLLKKYLTTIVYGISPTNVLLIAATCGALLLCSVGAVLSPALKAAGVDPSDAIRTE